MMDIKSPHRRIAMGFVWVGFFVFLGKLAGAAKEMAIAWRYGVGETVDAYVLTFNIVTLPVSLWFAVLTLVLLPLISKLRSQSPSQMERFQGELLGLTIFGGCLVGIVFWLGYPWLLGTGALGLTGGALVQASSMTGPLSFLLPIGLLVSVLSAWLMALGKHRNTLFEAIPALAILIAITASGGSAPEPLVWGTVAGFALQAFMLAWPMWRKEGIARPTLKMTSPVWPTFWAGIGMMVIGQALMTLTSVIDQVFAAHLDAGAISELSYASRIISLLASLGAMAVSRSTLPVFSDMIGSGDGDVERAASRWSFLMLILGLVVGAISWIASPWIVAFLFERGSFTAENTSSVSALLRLFLIHLPLYFSGLVLVSLLSARRAFKAIYRAAFLGFMGKSVALVVLFPKFGLAGIALSTAVMYLASLLSMKLTLKAKVS